MSYPVGVRSGWSGAGRISPLRGRPRLRLSFWLRRRFVRCRRFFTSLNRGAVTRDVSDQTIRVRVLDQRLVQSRWQSAGGEFGESPHENVASLGTSSLRCQPHNRCNVLSTDVTSCRRTTSRSAARWSIKLNHGFRDKGPSQCRTFRQRAPREVPGQPGRNASIRAMPELLIQLLVVFVQRATGRVVEPGQKFLLNMEPVSA